MTTIINLPTTLREFGVDLKLRDSENMGPTRAELAMAAEIERLRARLAERLVAYCVCTEGRSPTEGCDCVCCTTARLEARLAEAEALLRVSVANCAVTGYDGAAAWADRRDAFLKRGGEGR